MTRKPLGAAAALSLLGAAVLLALYWQAIWHLAAAVVAARFAWVVIRAKLGIRKTRRSGKSLWEVGFASLAGYLFGARRRDGHACLQCGHPIAAPSRAMYCSPACRKYAALERAATEERSARLAAFGDVPEGFGA